MKLGFLTACFADKSLSDIVNWASEKGFRALEVAAWPEGPNRPFTACHLPVIAMDRSKASTLRRLFDEHDLMISSIAYYDNNLHPDPDQRKVVNAHTLACIDAASQLECPTVGTFIGRDPTRTVRENLKVAEEVFKPLVARAGELGVSVVIENCVMEGWHPDGYPGNLAYSPELWEWMFSLGVYLNFDPSHLVWMGIDPVAALRPYVGQVRHVQAKDIEVFPQQRNRYGYPGRAVQRPDPWDVGWWRYRVPGLGQIEWRRIIDVLAEGGFEGVVSIEHEDPVWAGSTERVKTGLLFAKRTLDPLVIDL